MTSQISRSILVTLDYYKDPDSGLTRLSYRGIMRYSGVGKMANVSGAIKELSKMHALQVNRGQRIGITRECSAYRVTLDDPKFLDLCNRLFVSINPAVIRQQMGHTSAAMTRLYTGEIPIEQIQAEFSSTFGTKIDVLENMENEAVA